MSRTFDVTVTAEFNVTVYVDEDSGDPINEAANQAEDLVHSKLAAWDIPSYNILDHWVEESL